MRGEAEMIVRNRIAELAGGRVLTEDEEVAVLVAAGGIYDAIKSDDREGFMDHVVMLVEAWPKSLMLGGDLDAAD